MIGKKYEDVIKKLVGRGNWSIVASEDGWAELANMSIKDDRILNIEYKDGIVTEFYRIR